MTRPIPKSHWIPPTEQTSPEVIGKRKRKPKPPPPLIDVAFNYLNAIDARTMPPYAFGLFGKSGEMAHYKGRECYWYMMEFYGAKIVYTVFVHSNGAGEAEKLLYINWLLDKTCPWSDVVERQHKIIPKAWTPEFIVNHGYLVPDLHIASNWLLDFLMASRVSGEFPAFLPIWSMLVEAGVAPRVAMNFGLRFVRSQCKSAESEYVFGTVNNSNHFPFYIHVKSFDNFCLGIVDTKQFRPPYDENSLFTPVQSLWGTDYRNDYDLGLMKWNLEHLKEQHPELMAEVKSKMGTSSLSKPTVRTIFSKALLIKIALAEQARLKITHEAATDFISRHRPGSFERLPEERQGVCSPDGGSQCRELDVQAERVPDSPDAGKL